MSGAKDVGNGFVLVPNIPLERDDDEKEEKIPADVVYQETGWRIEDLGGEGGLAKEFREALFGVSRSAYFAGRFYEREALGLLNEGAGADEEAAALAQRLHAVLAKNGSARAVASLERWLDQAEAGDFDQVLPNEPLDLPRRE